MALDTQAVYLKVVQIVTALPEMQQVAEGVPLSLDFQQGAYVTVGGQAQTDLAFREYNLEARFLVVLAYAVGNQEGPAERWVARTVGALRAAVNADRTLGGTCVDARLEVTLSDTAEYEPFAAEEARRYPITIVTGHEEPA